MRTCKVIAAIVIAAAVFASAVDVSAAERIWTGQSVTPLWKDAANWEGNVIPAKSDELVFPVGITLNKTNTSNYDDDTVFQKLTFYDGGYHLNPSGRRLIFNSGIQSLQPNGTNEIAFALSAENPVTISCANAGAVLRLLGPIMLFFPITFDGYGDIEFASYFMGANGAINKNGQGTLTLSGTSSINYPVTVNAGTLLANYSLANPSNDVALNGGTLGGTSSVGKIVANGGTVSPGSNCVGKLTAVGDLSLGAASALKIEISAADYDQLIVKGAVDLGGANLVVSIAQGFTPAMGAKFTVIDNDGTDAVKGNFSALPQDGLLKVGETYLQVNYNGGDGGDTNNVVLTVVPAPKQSSTPPEPGTTTTSTVTTSEAEVPQAGIGETPNAPEVTTPTEPTARASSSGGCSLLNRGN